jgi:nicotinamidase/pyrazinamidase
MRAFFDIDTQMDFVFPAGALYAKGGERVIPHVAALNRHASANGIPLISSICVHPEDAVEFRDWPPHCVAGCLGQRKPAETLVENQRFIEKNALDVFSNPQTEKLLAELGIDEAVVYGVYLEFCVKCAVEGLLKSGRRITLVRDAVAAVSDTSLLNLAGITICDSSELLRSAQ